MVCHSLRHRGEELLGQRGGLEAYAKTGKTMGIPLLHPWANRLGAWSYEALGRHVELRASRCASTPAPACRCTARSRARGASSNRASPSSTAPPTRSRSRTPSACRRRSSDALRITTTIEAHDGPVPVSFGFHPFLLIPGVPRAEWHVELPVTRRLKLTGQQLPSGETEPVEPYAGPLGERAYDDGYDERADAPFVVAGGDRRIEVRFEEGFPFAQVYAPPDNDLISFEPMTAPTDALRVGGFPVAEPGKPYRAVFSVAVH